MDLNKFTQKAQQAVLEAQHLAQDYNHQAIDPAHLLLALLNQTESTVPVVISQIAGGVDVLQEEIRKEQPIDRRFTAAQTVKSGFRVPPHPFWMLLNATPRVWAMNIPRPNTFYWA